MAQVGSLYTSLTLESSSFISGLKKATDATAASAASIERNLNSAASAAKGFAAAIVGSEIAAAARRALDYASSLGETAQQLGVTTKDLQLYRFVAGQVGISQEEMDKGLQRLSRTLGDIGAGAKKPTEALRELGLSTAEITQLASGTAGDAIPRLVQAFSAIEDPTKRARIEVALFGKTGQQLDTLLAGGSDQINKLSAAAERLNLVLSPEQIKKADDAADAMTAVKTVLEANIAGVVADNAGAIVGLANSFAELAGQIGPAIQWLDRLDIKRQKFLATAESYLGGRPSQRAAASKRAADLNGQLGELTAKQISDNIGFSLSTASGPPARSRRSDLKINSGGGRSPRAKQLKDTKDLVDLLRKSALEASNALNQVTLVNADQQAADRAKSFYAAVGVDPDALSKQVAEIETIKDRAFQRDQQRWGEAARIQEEQVRTLAGIYQDAFRGGTKAIWQDFKSIGLSVVASVLAKFSLAKIGGKSFSFGDAFSTSLSSVLPGFATGGSFTVGGRGGVDSNLVAFRATRGERVDVHTPGSAPSLRGGPNLSLVINAPGATAETVSLIRRELANAAPVLVQAAQAATTRGLQRGRM